MYKDGKLTYWMRWVAGITAILIAYGSAKLSVAGIGIGGDLWWLNWVIAISLFVAEFLVNGKHEELNWMILVIGAGAYAYSVTTNLVGIEKYMQVAGSLDLNNKLDMVTMYAGGFFMDIYPELVLRWALGESKVGDLLGNLVKTYNNPQILTKSFTTVAPTHVVQAHKVNAAQRREELLKKYQKPDMDEDDVQFIRPLSHYQKK